MVRQLPRCLATSRTSAGSCRPSPEPPVLFGAIQSPLPARLFPSARHTSTPRSLRAGKAGGPEHPGPEGSAHTGGLRPVPWDPLQPCAGGHVRFPPDPAAASGRERGTGEGAPSPRKRPTSLDQTAGVVVVVEVGQVGVCRGAPASGGAGQSAGAELSLWGAWWGRHHLLLSPGGLGNPQALLPSPDKTGPGHAAESRAGESGKSCPRPLSFLFASRVQEEGAGVPVGWWRGAAGAEWGGQGTGRSWAGLDGS